METSDKKEGWLGNLQNAEAAHSDQVWEGIEMELDRAEVKKLRKSVFMYKWMAAASVVFAIISGVFTYWANQNNEPFDVTLAEVEIPNTGNAPSQPWQGVNNHATDNLNELAKVQQVTQAGNTPISKLTENRSLYLASDETQNTTIGFQKRPGSGKNFGLANYGQSLTQSGNSSNVYHTGILSNAMLSSGTSEGTVVESPLLQPKQEPLLASGTVVENDDLGEDAIDKKSDDKFWTALGFAAGTFSNATPTSPSAPATTLRSMAAGQTAASESNSPGYTYAVNVIVGTKVSDRWVLQGGMSYISQTSDYTATTVVSNPNGTTLMAASINQFEKSDNTQSSILSTSPYTVNNNIQMISFPLQAGLILMDRKVGFLINSGFSTDLFLQNTITPQVVNLEKSTQGRGDESPYKPLNVSGLFGSEVSYRFGENYRISLAPGLRYPFSSIYKSDLGIKSSPLTFDVAVRFRYILK